MAKVKAVGPEQLPVELLKLRMNHGPTGVSPGVSPGDQAGVAPTGSITAITTCRDKGFAQKEGQDRVR